MAPKSWSLTWYLANTHCHRGKSGRERSRVWYPSTGDIGEGDTPRITRTEIQGVVASMEGVAHITIDGIRGGDYSLALQLL